MRLSVHYPSPCCLSPLSGHCSELCTKGSSGLKRGLASLKLILICLYRDKVGREDHTNSNGDSPPLEHTGLPEHFENADSKPLQGHWSGRPGAGLGDLHCDQRTGKCNIGRHPGECSSKNPQPLRVFISSCYFLHQRVGVIGKRLEKRINVY